MADKIVKAFAVMRADEIASYISPADFTPLAIFDEEFIAMAVAMDADDERVVPVEIHIKAMTK